jgi:ABC-type uncharacterized transport system fused permease/ATPase subunit
LVLFLDEATNQLDQATETRILRNPATLGVTIVNIAHSEKAQRYRGRKLQIAAETRLRATPE